MILPIISLVCLGYVHGYPTGAPVESCNTMTPLHNKRAAPYTITPSKQTYRAGEVITVVLTGTSDFQGFMIQPRPDKHTTTTIGTMIPDAAGVAKLQTCPTGKSSLTQSSDAHKTTVTVTWTAPTSDQGSVYFVATVVGHFDTFWTKITHEIPLVFDASTTVTPNPTTTDAAGHVTASLAAILSCVLYNFL